MKRFLLVLALVLLPMMAFASPNLTCDPYPTTVVQPTEFGIIMDTLAEVYSAVIVNTDGSKVLMYDLVAVPVGNHNVKVRACVPDPTTTPAGRSCSDYSPFAFSVTPKIPTVPRLFLKP
jgi:hypothetical protein